MLVDPARDAIIYYTLRPHISDMANGRKCRWSRISFVLGAVEGGHQAAVTLVTT